MKLYKSDSAKKDLLDIWLFIAADNIAAADIIQDEFHKSFLMLCDNPFLGRSCQDLGKDLRCWPVKKYLVFYRPKTSSLEIIRVLHAARDIEIILENM